MEVTVAHPEPSVPAGVEVDGQADVRPLGVDFVHILVEDVVRFARGDENSPPHIEKASGEAVPIGDKRAYIVGAEE